MKTLRHQDHPGIRIHHHSDWYGEVQVRYPLPGDTITRVWCIRGALLIAGTVDDPLDQDKKPVPVHIVAQAVSLAVRNSLTSQLVEWAEDHV